MRACLWAMAYLKYPCSDCADVFRHTYTHPHTTATSTYAPSTVGVLKTYNTVKPHIDYWPVARVVTCLRNASSSFRICAVANTTVGVGQAVVWRRWPQAVTIVTRSTAVNTTQRNFIFNRTSRNFHAGNIRFQHFTSTQLSWTLLRYVMYIDTILEFGTVNCISNFPVSLADVRQHYDMLYGTDSYPITHYAHFKCQSSFNCTANRQFNYNERLEQ